MAWRKQPEKINDTGGIKTAGRRKALVLHHRPWPQHDQSPSGKLVIVIHANLYQAFAGHIFDGLIATLSETRLEPDLEDLLWSTVNVFHRATARIERELDDNEQALRRSQPSRTEASEIS